MAEIIGTTVGVVGFLGQLFDGCVKAYGYFTEATHMDADGQRLLCKVRIEEMRLVVWGRAWGVAEGTFEAHLDRSCGVGDGGGGSNNMPQLRRLARQILEELHSTVTDFKKLKETYGLVDEPQQQESGEHKDKENNAGKGKGGKTKSEKSWRKEFTLRSKWVIAGVSRPILSVSVYVSLQLTNRSDKEKFTTLLKDLKGEFSTPSCLLVFETGNI